MLYDPISRSAHVYQLRRVQDPTDILWGRDDHHEGRRPRQVMLLRLGKCASIHRLHYLRYHAENPFHASEAVFPIEPEDSQNSLSLRHNHRKTPIDLRSLGSLGGSHLLAILVVSYTRGRSTVAAALSGSDTVKWYCQHEGSWVDVEGTIGGCR